MRSRAPWRWAGALGAVVLVVLCVLPVAVLVPAALANPGIAAGALSPRRLGLLAASARLASGVFVLDTLIAGATVLWAASAPRRRALPVLAVALAAAFVPPVAHGAAWSGIADALRSASGLAVSPLSGLLAAVLAQSTAFLPLAIAIGLAGVTAIDPHLLDAARVQRSDRDALLRVAVPLALPAILAGGGIAALLSLGDEAVPAVFQVDTAAMELFASYAADGSAGATLAIAWPLALAAAVVALACAVPLGRVSLSAGSGRRMWSVPPRLDPTTRAVLGIAAAVSAGLSILVFAALCVGAWPPSVAVAAIVAAGPDLALTCTVAVVCALIAALIGLLAGAPAGPGRPPSRWVWALALVAAVVPAPVIGAGLVEVYNTAWTGALYDSAAMLVLAPLARFAPIAAVVVAVAAARLDRRPIEAALVAAAPSRALVRVILPQLVRPAIAGGLLAGAFAAGELGATLMVIPPGSSTAVVRAFNLLHYGATQEVAAIALAVAAVGIVGASGAWALGMKAGRG